MPCPGVGPCEVWDLDLSCCLGPSANLPDPCMLEGNPVPQDVIDSAKKAASEFLWMKTGMQFGCCTVVVRPCRNKCQDECCIPGIGDSNYGYGTYPWYPVHLSNGDWTNISCGCKDQCSCTNLCEIDLPYPVCSVDEVKIDGLVLDDSEYIVHDFRKLVRIKSPQPVLRDIIIRTLQVGIDTSGDQYCFSPNADSAIGAAPVANSDCWTFIDSNPEFDFNSVKSVIAKYDDPTGPEEDGIFQFADSNGTWFFPTNSNPMTVGETRFSDPRLNGDRISITWNGPGVGPTYNGLSFERLAEAGSFTVTNLSLQPGGCWPECNNLTLADTEVGTWSVTVTYGRPVPELVRRAANELACEFIKHCQGAPCRLPQRLSSVNRQGVSISFLDPMEFMGQGLTGIYAVDLAIKTYNPNGNMRRPVVYSPDVAKKWTVETWRPGDSIGPGCT